MEIPVVKTQGIILRKAELSDTDRLLTVYTEKFGKILVKARGVGKKESKLKSFIEPFNIYELMLAKSKNIDVLANSYPVKEFLNLRSNLESLALAFYFTELVDKLIPAPEQDINIWQLLERAMEVVNKNSKSPPAPLSQRGGLLPLKKGGWEGFDKLKEAFEERLLGYLGHPTSVVRGKSTEREKQNYFSSLAGEEINSIRFLRSLSLIN